MAINDSAVVPLYQQVKDDIRAAIESGKYKTNEKIPPEPELSAEYSVSRITVRRLNVSPSELLDVRLSPEDLSEQERKVIMAYRTKPDLRKAVNILLGIE